MTWSIGLTGGIGSGKSTVAQVFEALGVPVYYSDARGRFLLAHDPDVQKQVQHHFGAEVFRSGQPDRAALAAKVFGNPKGLEQLNQIIHPAVGRDFQQWKAKQNSGYVLKESAILFEHNLHLQSDKTILVVAPEAVRIRRVMARDEATEAAVRARMKHQWSDDQKEKLADFVVVNDDQQMVIPQVLAIHQELQTLVNRPKN
ncbi:MAG: dephospho-CoA kinase [Salibacteraceae bacterium]